jgi:hypothetical protein
MPQTKSERVARMRAGLTGRLALPVELTPILDSMPQAEQRRYREMPNTWRGTYVRAMSGRSPKAAFKAMCGECMGWLRADIPGCTAKGCPLYPYRPWK